MFLVPVDSLHSIVRHVELFSSGLKLTIINEPECVFYKEVQIFRSTSPLKTYFSHKPVSRDLSLSLFILTQNLAGFSS